MWSAGGYTWVGYEQRRAEESDVWRRSHLCWAHALLNIISVELHLKLNQHTAHCSGPASTCPLCSFNISHYPGTEWKSSEVDDLQAISTMFYRGINPKEHDVSGCLIWYLMWKRLRCDIMFDSSDDKCRLLQNSFEHRGRGMATLTQESLNLQ